VLLAQHYASFTAAAAAAAAAHIVVSGQAAWHPAAGNGNTPPVAAAAAAATAAAAAATDGQFNNVESQPTADAVGGKAQQLGLWTGPRVSSTPKSARRLQQQAASGVNLQQALQSMLAVPIATPRSVLARGYKGVEVDALRNWHLLARKLSTPGTNVTIVAFGGSITAGYMKFKKQEWKNSMEGSWVEQLVSWFQVSVPVTKEIS
jgi:hypothetical protein